MSYTKAIALMNKGPSRPTLFEVRLPNRRISRGTNEYLSFFCKATAIPEVRTNTVAVAGHEHMGIVREQATNVMFGKPFTMTVIIDNDFTVYDELRSWFDDIAQNSNQDQRGFRTQRMNYSKTYVEDMQLIKYEQPERELSIGSILGFDTNEYKKVLTVNFINAFPIQISQVTLNTETTNTVTEFNIDFTYESYTLER